MKQGFPVPQKGNYKVYVRTCTFNQLRYIEDTLNGVAMQETNFPFVHHVIDDASTDGQQDFIKLWMDRECDMEHAECYENELSMIFSAKNNSNPNCTLVVYFLKKNLFGNPEKEKLFKPWRESCSYEAFCEGDDYWTNAKKLQKQADLLDLRPDISLCCHQVACLNIDTGVIDEHYFDCQEGETCTVDLAKGNYIQTLSVMMRLDRRIFEKYMEIDSRIIGDYALWFSCSLYGNIYKLPDCMAVYRLGSGFFSSKSGLKRHVFLLSLLNRLRCYTIDAETRAAFDKQISEIETLVGTNGFSMEEFQVTRCLGFSNLHRDWSLIKYGFKYLVKDIFSK